MYLVARYLPWLVQLYVHSTLIMRLLESSSFVTELCLRST